MSLDSYLATRSDRCQHGYARNQGCPTCTPATPDQGKAGAAGANEWSVFVAAVRQVVRPDGTVHACDLRPLLRNRIEPRRLSSLYRTARHKGLLVEVGHERSNDERGRNAGRMEPYYSLGAAA